MNVDEQVGVVTVAQKYDYDKDGQVVEFPPGSFFEILSRFRLFVIKNKRYPLMDGEHDEVALRKWFREVGHGLVPITDEQKILFDNLGVEFADVPKNRSQLEKITEKEAASEGDGMFAREDLPSVDEDEEELAEPEIEPELAKLFNTPIRHLSLSDKTAKTLIKLGYDTFVEIPQIESSQVLVEVRKGGLEATHEVEEYLESYNLTFGMSYEEIVEQIELPDEVDVDKLSSSKRRKAIPRTIQATLDLAKQGYTFEAIVSKRELSALTISKHLSYLILHDLVDVSDFVDSYLYNRISEIVRDLPKGATVKKVKSKCPEGFRRSTIRMVMADLKRKLKE
jgi:hypothetical protein